MMTSGVRIFRDNARIAAHKRPLLEHFIWALFDHPSYSLDLNPSDCQLFV
jgi:hypothetical protein